MSRPASRALLSLLLALSIVSVARAELYEIKLTRPQKVGDQQRIAGTSTSELTRTAVVGGKAKPPQQGQSVVIFDMVGQVLQVDEKGRAVSASYAIEKLVRKDVRGENEILKKGAAVTATVVNGNVVFKLKDGELNAEARAALGEAVSLFAGGSDDDETFGTGLKQKVGESWPIDPAAVVANMSRQGMTVEPGDVAGGVKLVALKTMSATPVLEVVAVIQIRKLTPPEGTVPPGQRIEKNTLAVRAAGMFPTDPALQPLGAKVEIEKTTVVSGKVGAEQTETQVTTTEKHTREVTTTPVK